MQQKKFNHVNRWKTLMIPSLLFTFTVPFFSGCTNNDAAKNSGDVNGTLKGNSSDEKSTIAQNDGEKVSAITIDTHRCVGCGKCARVASANFAMDTAAKKAIVISQDRNDESAIDQAEEICPVGAINA